MVVLCAADPDNGDKAVAHYGPYAWRDRTYTTAHEYLADHWEDVTDGAVLDVEVILGETARAS